MVAPSRNTSTRPNQCPKCGSDVSVEPGPLFGEVTCPNCHLLLWFMNLNSQLLVFDRSAAKQTRQRVIETLAQQLGVPADEITEDSPFLNDLTTDSLDVVELIMAIEAEYGLE